MSGRHFIEKVTNNMNLNGYSIGHRFPPLLLPAIVGGAWHPPKTRHTEGAFSDASKAKQGTKIIWHKNAQEVYQEVVTGAR